MHKHLQKIIPVGFRKMVLVAAFAFVGNLSSFGQDLKTGISERPLFSAHNVTKIFKEGFERVNKVNQKNQNIGHQARVAVQHLPLNSQIFYPDATHTGWIMLANVRYTYDAQGRQTSYTRIPVTPQSIIEKDSSVYDVHGNETFNAGYSFHVPTNSWRMNGGIRSQFTYNTAGRPTEIVNEGWDMGLGVWKNSNRQVVIYNAAGFPTEQTNYLWRNNSWAPDEKYIFSFAVATNPPSGMLMQVYNGSAWENQVRYQNITWHDFDKEEHLTMEGQMWFMNSWVNAIKSTVAYDAFGGSVEIIQMHNGLTWENDERTTITNNSKMHFISRKTEEWQNNAWVFADEWQESLTYNALDQITEKISIAWDPTSSTMKTNQRAIFSNFLIMGTQKALPALTVNVYPNPATDLLHIKTAEAGNIQAVLTDLTGKVVLNQMLSDASNRELRLGVLAKGTYLLRLETKKGISLRKIVKQ